MPVSCHHVTPCDKIDDITFIYFLHINNQKIRLISVINNTFLLYHKRIVNTDKKTIYKWLKMSWIDRATIGYLKLFSPSISKHLFWRAAYSHGKRYVVIEYSELICLFFSINKLTYTQSVQCYNMGNIHNFPHTQT